MRVLVTGATGVIGRALTPLLVSVGHEAHAVVRPESSLAVAERLGAHAVVGDLLDPVSVRRLVTDIHPEAIVHMATAIPRRINPRTMAADFAVTNRLRAEGTRNLLAAASAVGTSRVVAQGLAFAYDPSDDGLATEDDPLWRRPPRQFAPVLAALRQLENQTVGAGGVVLRFGHLYGPGTGFAADGAFAQQVRAGKVPVVGGGTAVFSFTHAHDTATAVVAALDKEVTGALNIVDDDPAPVRDWLPRFAELLGGPPPKRVPTALARLGVGGWGVAYMTKLRGADNAFAKLALDWKPRYGSWDAGFVEELCGTPGTRAGC